jgi:predicted phosphohydrolase
MNAIYNDIIFLHNLSVVAEDVAICGSRGWICPGTDGYTEADNKIYLRELLRISRSIEDAKAKGVNHIIGVLHFPPTNDKLQSSGFTEIFSKAGVKTVVYGHLHGSETYHKGLQGNFNGVEYKLVSLDYLKCKPLQLEAGGTSND